MNSKIIEIEELNHADRDASVKLVSIDGTKYVLKKDDIREVAAQKYFNEQLKSHHIPALTAHTHVALQPNQILLEYVKDSLTLGNVLSEARCRAWGELVSRIHAVKVNDFFVFSNNGEQINTDWSSYVKNYIDTAVARHRVCRIR